MSERLDSDEHRRRGTFRNDRHADDEAPPEYDRNGEAVDPRQQVSEADRARLLRGLPPTAKTIAERLLDTYWDFDPAMLFTLEVYARSCDRLGRLQAQKVVKVEKLHAEILINLRLVAALNLGG